MIIPNLPTDNIYKFFSILGMILIIGAILILSYTGLKFLTNAKTSDSKLGNVENQTIVIKSIDKTIPILTISKTFLILGIVFSLPGFTLWYLKTQRYQDKILKKETKKYLEEQNLRIRTIQFAKEYEIYESLWNELSTLRIEISKLENEVQRMSE